jgi:fructuronate reductase
MGIDDEGKAFVPSPDPRLSELMGYMKNITLGNGNFDEKGIDQILKDESIFGIDLFSCGIADKVKEMFQKMIAGPGAVRRTLCDYCS